MKKNILFLFLIIFTFLFSKDEELFNIKVNEKNSKIGSVIEYSTIPPTVSSKKDDLYFFSLGKEYIYINSFFIQVKHEKEEHSKQFYNYFVLRVKKSQEEEKTSIDKIFKEKTTENSEVFIFSCYEKISESEKTPIYYNIFYRNGKIVSIIRLAKKEDIKNLVENLILNNILSEKEKNYINLITESLNK